MKKKFLQGMIKRHPDGFGFFIPDQADHPDVYVPRHSMKGAMTNDRVMIDVFPEKGSQRFRGEIVKIVSRGTKSIVGTFFQMNSTTGLVRDEGKGWGEDLKVALKDSMNAGEGELVSIEITSYPGEGEGFRGKVTQVIGHAMDPLTDVTRVLLQANIPHEFPTAVEKESQDFTSVVADADMKGRRDLRQMKFITIDGATAKDFDDAILVETNDQGFKLFVAIADVSHYVRPGTAIDKEAYVRGTSVYFPNFVVPMLPEVLSNGLCSLNPHVARLSVVAEIQMDFTGQVLKSEFYEAVIESKARVTYGEAQEVIDGSDIEKLLHVKPEILLAADLAKVLMAKRTRDGSLDLEIPETEIVLDSAGIPIDFIRSERLFAHRLIEEMMLAANVAVAKFFAEKEIAAVFRIHEPPNADAIALLEKYLNNFGSQVNVNQGKLQKRLTRALQEFEGKPEAQILNILTLRSMSQAKYSAENVGHFGLGFEFYTHFTSPIRRYPDLIVHRLLKSLIMPNSSYRMIPEDELQTSATMLSACEQRSVKAERQFQSIKKARFMHKFLGEEFEGIISSVTKFGVFVLLRQFEVDGLIRTENLSKEKLEFDEDNLVLVGKRSGMQFAIGDILTVRVDSADPESGQVDFGLVAIGDQPSEMPLVLQERKARKEFARGGKRSEKLRESPRREARGRKPERDEKPSRDKHSKPKPKPKERKENRPHQKSRKAQALDEMESRVYEILSDAKTESDERGQKFDPEKHLQMALKKWKERNADAPPARRFVVNRDTSEPKGKERESRDDHSQENEPQEKKKTFFDKFKDRASSGGGKKKNSSKRGKRR